MTSDSNLLDLVEDYEEDDTNDSLTVNLDGNDEIPKIEMQRYYTEKPFNLKCLQSSPCNCLDGLPRRIDTSQKSQLFESSKSKPSCFIDSFESYKSIYTDGYLTVNLDSKDKHTKLQMNQQYANKLHSSIYLEPYLPKTTGKDKLYKTENNVTATDTNDKMPSIQVYQPHTYQDTGFMLLQPGTSNFLARNDVTQKLQTGAINSQTRPLNLKINPTLDKNIADITSKSQIYQYWKGKDTGATNFQTSPLNLKINSALNENTDDVTKQLQTQQSWKGKDSSATNTQTAPLNLKMNSTLDLKCDSLTTIKSRSHMSSYVNKAIASVCLQTITSKFLDKNDVTQSFNRNGSTYSQKNTFNLDNSNSELKIKTNSDISLMCTQPTIFNFIDKSEVTKIPQMYQSSNSKNTGSIHFQTSKLNLGKSYTLNSKPELQINVNKGTGLTLLQPNVSTTVGKNNVIQKSQILPSRKRKYTDEAYDSPDSSNSKQQMSHKNKSTNSIYLQTTKFNCVSNYKLCGTNKNVVIISSQNDDTISKSQIQESPKDQNKTNFKKSLPHLSDSLNYCKPLKRDNSSDDVVLDALRLLVPSTTSAGTNLEFVPISSNTSMLHQSNYEKPEFICKICKNTFKKLETYIQHKNIHVHLNYEKCTDCGKIFDSIHDLAKHTVTHDGRIAFQCINCGEMFLNKTQIKEHILFKHPQL